MVSTKCSFDHTELPVCSFLEFEILIVHGQEHPPTQPLLVSVNILIKDDIELVLHVHMHADRQTQKQTCTDEHMSLSLRHNRGDGFQFNCNVAMQVC